MANEEHDSSDSEVSKRESRNKLKQQRRESINREMEKLNDTLVRIGKRPGKSNKSTLKSSIQFIQEHDKELKDAYALQEENKLLEAQIKILRRAKKKGDLKAIKSFLESIPDLTSESEDDSNNLEILSHSEAESEETSSSENVSDEESEESVSDEESEESVSDEESEESVSDEESEESVSDEESEESVSDEESEESVSDEELEESVSDEESEENSFENYLDKESEKENSFGNELDKESEEANSSKDDFKKLMYTEEDSKEANCSEYALDYKPVLLIQDADLEYEAKNETEITFAYAIKQLQL